MDALVQIGEPTMSSREIAVLVEKRHDNVKRTIETLAARGVIVRPQFEDEPGTDTLGRQRPERVYRINKRDSYVIVAQLSPEFTARLVDRWQELEQQRQLSPAEMALHNAQVMVALERQQREQGEALAAIGSKVGRIETAMTVQASRPAGSESITHIRPRIGKLLGLSAKVIDDVMRQSPYAPKPAAMVRNDDPRAEGGTYAVYWQKDVTAVFRRFADECQQASPTMWTHPFIEGRFKLVREAS